MDKIEVSEKIVELMGKRGLTRSKLAEKLHQSEMTVMNYEAGTIDIPLSALIGIAEALDVEPAVLFGGARDDLDAEITVRVYREEDRRTMISILGMNGYTTRQVKVARKGKKSSWYCIKAKSEDGNLMSQ